MTETCGVALTLVCKRVSGAWLAKMCASCMFLVKVLPNYVGDISIAEKTGAGERDRTVVVSLEGFCSTIELHPRCNDFTCSVNQWWRGLDSNQRTRKRADLQSAAINHSATSPRNPILSGFSDGTSNVTVDRFGRGSISGPSPGRKGIFPHFTQSLPLKYHPTRNQIACKQLLWLDDTTCKRLLKDHPTPASARFAALACWSPRVSLLAVFLLRSRSP